MGHAELNTDIFRRKFSAMVNTRMEAGSVEEDAENMNSCLAAACDASMPRRASRPGRPPVPWWNEDLARLRAASLAARRLYQRKRRRHNEEACVPERDRYRQASRDLRLAILAAKER